MVVEGRGKRLRSWKEIAAFFGADVRTVKRWETGRGLPVHRPPGEARAAVFAYVDELTAWLERDPPAPKEEPDAAAAPVIQRPIPRWPIAIAASLILAALALPALRFVRGGAVASAQGERVQDPLYLSGIYHLGTRTAAGIALAVRELDHYSARDPRNADAFAYLAEARAMQVQYADVDPAEGYGRASTAANRALALDPASGRALAVLGLVAFYRDHDLRAAEAYFARATAAAPETADIHHWYALVMMHGGDQRRPLAEIGRAQAIEPGSRAILATRALILFHAGQTGPAETLLRQLARAEPDLRSAPEYLATLYMAERRWPDFLAASRAAARITDDKARLVTIGHLETAWRLGGEAGLLRGLYADQSRAHAAGQVPAFKLAQTAMLLGDRAAALRWIERAAADREPDLVGILLEPALRPLHGDPRFDAIVRQTGLAAPTASRTDEGHRA